MSNQEESAPTPPVDRHDGFSQGPRAWWALWTKLVQWGVGNPWIVWSLVAVNLISSAAGYVYWYGAVSYTHLRAHETDSYLVCRLLLEKKKNNEYKDMI